MKGLFSLDGPFYKIGNLIYYSMVGNALCTILAIPAIVSLVIFGYDSVVGLLALIIFSSPIGPGLTASFYMMRKLQKDESSGPLKEFWKSLRLNFKQASSAWIVLAAIGTVIYINITNISILGNLSKFMLPIQFLLAIELIFTGIYVFPMISKYENPLRLQLKAAFMLSNGHLPTTISCVLIAAILLFFLYYYPAAVVLLGIGLYAFISGWFIEKVFHKHWPEEKEDDIMEEEN